MKPGRKTVDGQKRLGRLCAVVAAEDAGAMGRQVRLALTQTPTVELRLDWLRNDNERERFLRWLARQKFAGATFIATCRRVEGGGRFTGDVRSELFWLARAREARCTWCDLELESVRKLPGRSVEAARKAGMSNLKILLAGEGPHEQELIRRIYTMGLVDTVRLLGHVDTLPVYQAADALLLPSGREGFSLVCAEAMAVGLPVLRTRTSGTRELIVEGVTGQSVPINHSAFVSAAVEFLRDRDALVRMGKAARQRIEEQFTFDRQASDMLKLYEQLESAASLADRSKRG